MDTLFSLTGANPREVPDALLIFLPFYGDFRAINRTALVRWVLGQNSRGATNPFSSRRVATQRDINECSKLDLHAGARAEVRADTILIDKT